MSFFYNQKTFCFLLSFLFCVTGCVDLSGTKTAFDKSQNTISKSTSMPNKPRYKVGEVHTMRGGLGIFSIGMNQLSAKVTDRFQIATSSSMWYDAGHLSNFLIKDHYNEQHPRPIILVGHSLGANEQIKVARNLGKYGIPVDLLVTVDAVSPTRVTKNVKHVVNLYKPGIVPMFSGIKIKADDPNATWVENIDVRTLKGIKVNHFTIDKDTLVQDMILDDVEKVLIHANRKEG